jgi:hypothetical protein
MIAAVGGDTMSVEAIMTPSSRLALACTVLAAIGGAAFAQPPQGGVILTATLSGVAEVPGPGDPDGSGTFTATVIPGKKQICYDIIVAGIETPTAAHIHKGSPDEAGPVFVTLTTPPLGKSSSCVDITSQQATAILGKPSDYYVNVHTAPPFAAGAIRGPLTRAS